MSGDSDFVPEGWGRIAKPDLPPEVVEILRNLQRENTGWRRWFRRWKISAEPLRADARLVLRKYGYEL